MLLPQQQQYTASSQGTPGSIIVNVSGSVTYGDDKQKKFFSQSFILSPDASNGSFFIWSDNFRHI
jgi:NTF2-related export protein 1/2